MSEVEQIIKQIRRLPKDKQQLIRLWIGGGQPVTSLRSTEDWLLPGITQELNRRGFPHPPLTEKYINKVAPKYFEQVSYLTKELRKRTEVVMSHAQWCALGGMLISTLIEYLKLAKVPISSKALLMHISKLPEAIENSYPGYLESNMLHALIGLLGGNSGGSRRLP